MKYPDELNQDQEKTLKREIEFNKSVVRAVERYERLVNDPDFTSHLDDLREAVTVIDKEILSIAASLADSKTDKAAAFDSIYRYALEKEIKLALIRRPQDLVDAGKVAKERLPELEAKLDGSARVTTKTVRR